MLQLLRKIPSLQCIGREIKKTTTVTYAQKRHIFGLLYSALNKFDEERLHDFGPDRVCAEWILRNSGRIRWKGTDEWLSDYNFLPPETAVEHFKVQDIDASGTSIMKQGFVHLDNLEYLQSIKIHDCHYVDNNCMKNLFRTWQTLEKLQVSSCKRVTDEGIMQMKELINLTDLHLKDLPGVSDKVGCYQQLQRALPKCDIFYVDAEDEQHAAKGNGH